ACAPGSYDDGTGKVRSEAEIADEMSAFVAKTKQNIGARFKESLTDSKNVYFKDMAMAALGLQGAPQCMSNESAQQDACVNNLIEGLTNLAQKQALGDLLPKIGLERRGNLKDLEYLTENGVFQRVVAEVNNQVKKDLGREAMEKKIREDIFPKLQVLIAERIKKLQIPPDQKRVMVNKINAIEFRGTNCSEVGAGETAISSLLFPNAMYNPNSNTFKFCGGYLTQSNSEFQIAMSIGHELSHSIDPCRIADGPEGLAFKYSETTDIKKLEAEYPIKNVVQCLRDSRSIGARPAGGTSGSGQATANMLNLLAGAVSGTGYNPYGMTYPSEPNQGTTSAPFSGSTQLKRERVRVGVARSPEPAATAGAPMYGGTPPPQKASFCGNDQITESFSDWMSSEVLPDYISQNHKLTVDQYRTGYGNARRPICATGEKEKGGVHPAIADRINKIILANPKIRTQMGCPAQKDGLLYCDSEKSITSQRASSRPTPQESADDGRGVK
ncbi:MAG: hypothetical protein AABZ31_07555, partial [Bdellovibrionota bacterium]